MKKIYSYLLTTEIIFISVLTGCSQKVAVNHRDKTYIPILMYHQVAAKVNKDNYKLTVTPKEFSWQMNYLDKKGYKAITLNQAYDIIKASPKVSPNSQRRIVITFDDGYKNNYTYAYPILKKHNFKATIFVVANKIENPKSKSNISKFSPRGSMLNWAELSDMHKYGIEIGSHTMNHPKLDKISSVRAKYEIARSKKYLEGKLDTNITTFAYPYGELNNTIEKLVKNSGYKLAVSINKTIKYNDIYSLQRVEIDNSCSKKKFKSLIKHYGY